MKMYDLTIRWIVMMIAKLFVWIIQFDRHAATLPMFFTYEFPDGSTLRFTHKSAQHPLTPEQKEFIDEHLAEGRVFHRYGLPIKARDEFEFVLRCDPNNVAALLELAGLYREIAQFEAAKPGLRK